MTDRHAVAAYWASEEGRRRAPLLWLQVDLADPACFGCGLGSAEWPATTTFARRWNESKLDVAHVVAASSGGSDDPSNLVLLCPECHAAAPMVTDPGPMLRWVQAREHHEARRMRAVLEELAALGVAWHPDPSAINPSAFHRAAEEIGAGLHGSKMSPATVALVVARLLT